jgi:hypothetical protein
MTSPAFSSRSDCPIPYVPAIEPDLIQDCVIPPAPDPFFEAPAFPPIIPPITVGCPPIKVSASVHKTDSGDPELSANTGTYDPSGDECFPQIDLDLFIPYACPEMEVRTKKFRVAERADLDFGIVQDADDAPDCGYKFDLDIVFPCTQLEVEASAAKLSWNQDPKATFDVTKDFAGGQCKLFGDMKLGIPTFDDIKTAAAPYSKGMVTEVELEADGNDLKLDVKCNKVTGRTDYKGEGTCLDKIDLSYEDDGKFVLTVAKTSCVCTYC